MFVLPSPRVSMRILASLAGRATHAHIRTMQAVVAILQSLIDDPDIVARANIKSHNMGRSSMEQNQTRLHAYMKGCAVQCTGRHMTRRLLKHSGGAFVTWTNIICVCFTCTHYRIATHVLHRVRTHHS